MSDRFRLILEMEGRRLQTDMEMCHAEEGVPLTPEIVLHELDYAVRRLFRAYCAKKGWKSQCIILNHDPVVTEAAADE